VQKPPTHSPEQHCPDELQASPSSVHELAPEQTPETHALPQHCALDVHETPFDLQWPALEHAPLVASQYSEQHELAALQLVPSDLHWLVTEQRFLPSTSTSQCPEQHSASAAQASLPSLHDEAGTEQIPLTQLSEQQSVFLLQLWW
jgi:hypothetical protein